MLELLLDLQTEYYLSEDKTNFWMTIEDEGAAQIFRDDIDERTQKYVTTRAVIAARQAELEGRKSRAIKTGTPKTISTSGAIIVKNEEAAVEMALLSIYDVVDEICVLDTGSTDNTKNIVRQYPKVKLKEENMIRFDFSIARNMNFKMCSGDDIFVIDADEWLMEDRLAKTEGNIGFSTITEFQNHKARARITQPRLYPKDSVIWKNQVHNRTEIITDEPIAFHCEQNDMPLYHFKDYNKKKVTMRKDRTEDFKERMNNEPDCFKKYYIWMKLAMGTGDIDTALEAGDRGMTYYKVLDWNGLKQFSDFTLSYVRALYASKQFKKAKDPLSLHATINGLTTDSAFYHYVYAVSQEEPILAANYLEKHFQLMQTESCEPYFFHDTLEYYDQARLMAAIYSYWMSNLRIA